MVFRHYRALVAKSPQSNSEIYVIIYLNIRVCKVLYVSNHISLVAEVNCLSAVSSLIKSTLEARRNS
jgi:hypothetical protein